MEKKEIYIPHNQAQFYFDEAQRNLSKTAFILPKTWDKTKVLTQESFTYEELSQRIYKFQNGLTQSGFKQNDRVLILAPLSTDLYVLLIALISNGIVPIFLDPGLSRKQMMQSLAMAEVKAIFSVQKVLKYRFLFFKLLKYKLFSFDGDGLFLESFKNLSQQGPIPELAKREVTSSVLLTFTSGSTGKPRAANRQLDVIAAQHLLSRWYWPESQDEIDMPCFPMIALQNLACGITTVLPAIDFRNPGDFDPERVAHQILDHKVSRLSGAPAFLNNLTKWAVQNNVQFNLVRSTIVGGATVSKVLAQQITHTFPNAKNYIVYGSTEAEPISFVDLNEYLSESFDNPWPTYLVGKALPELQVKVVRFPQNLNEVHGKSSAHFQCPPGNEGEIILSGPHVLKEYINDPRANYETKIKDDVGEIWHRTGDLGFIDQQGRIHLTGRIKDALKFEHQNFSVANYPFENRLEQLAEIDRAAIIQNDDHTKTVVFIQPKSIPSSTELRQKIKNIALELGLPIDQIIELEKLPVDHRHQWKIQRETLRRKYINNLK